MEINNLYGFDGSGMQLGMTMETPLLAVARLKVGDVLQWSHILPSTLCFQAQCDGIPTARVSSVRTAQLTKLVALILLNFPELLYAPRALDELRMISHPIDHPYIVYPPTAPDMSATLLTVGTPDCCVLPASSAPRLIQGLRAHIGPKCVVKAVLPHPTLTRLGCLWVGKQRRSRHRRHFLDTAAASSRRKGRMSLTGRDQNWGEESPVFQVALAAISWRDIRTVAGSTVWGERLLYRLKIRGLNTYLPTTTRRRCPHPSCNRDQVKLSHVFWECSAATALWKTYLHAWSASGHKPDIAASSSVFTFALTRLPPEFVDRLKRDQDWRIPDRRLATLTNLYEAAQKCWRLGVVTVLQVIWKWRLEFLGHNPKVDTKRFIGILQIRLRQSWRQLESIYMESRYPSAVRRAMHLAVSSLNAVHLVVTTTVTSTSSVFVLFFDGGSRGNPGAGGSGSVIVMIDATTGSAFPCWIGSMAYGRTSTTNNQAEYRGLLHGLQQAAKDEMQPLHVVGDSQLIIKQQKGRRPPKAPHLLKLYLRCRALADQCSVRTWTHHYRSFNKTAGALANLAMDTKSNRQLKLDNDGAPFGAWDQALTHVKSDLMEWQSRIPDLLYRADHP